MEETYQRMLVIPALVVYGAAPQADKLPRE